MTKPNKTQQGFTLIELVIVMVVGGILATMTTSIITLPVKAYIDSTRRATLTDSAELALRRMQRDIRRALPNSIRITNSGTEIELLHVSDGGRYRAKLSGDGSGDKLDFTTNDTSFDVIGTLNKSPAGKVVIYNLGYGTPSDAYAAASGIRSNTATIAASSTTTQIDISPAKKFPLKSPEQRFFIIDSKISYTCSGNTLNRVETFFITPADPVVGIQTKTNNTLSCEFSYDAGSSTRAGLVTLSLTLTDDANESITLIHQVHVDNQP